MSYSLLQLLQSRKVMINHKMKIRYCFGASPLALNSPYPFLHLTEKHQKIASVVKAGVPVVLKTWCRVLTHPSNKSSCLFSLFFRTVEC